MYLISTTEVYRAETEAEAKAAIEAAKADSNYELIKYMNEYKEKKLKGEVVETYYKLTLTKSFNDIKDPYNKVDIVYNSED